MTYQSRFAFDRAEPTARAGAAPDVLELDLDGYEGPLHVLLELARRQKIDLREISISALADQYLAFVHEVRRIRLEPAADHLVMAAWLAELKSRLLLPKPEAVENGSPAAEDAAQLARRLLRLEAVHRAADALVRRPRLGCDVFPRGDPSALRSSTAPDSGGDLLRLLKAYPLRVRRGDRRGYAPAPRHEALALAAARSHIEAFLPQLDDWTLLERIVPAAAARGGPAAKSRVASTLAASLELAREARLRLRQDGPGTPVLLRAVGEAAGA